MNREILFKGCTVLGNRWIKGIYIPFTDKQFGYIIDRVTGEQILCYNKSIGQYTGLTDKNGEKIFEGDIVRYETIARNGYDGIYKVVFEDRNGCGYFGIAYSDIETCFFCYSVPASQMEVIGNLYDNPELLRSENE